MKEKIRLFFSNIWVNFIFMLLHIQPELLDNVEHIKTSLHYFKLRR